MGKSIIVIEEESITQNNHVFLKRKKTITSSRGVDNFKLLAEEIMRAMGDEYGKEIKGFI